MLAAAPAAQAQSFDLPDVQVLVEVQSDGSLVVTEEITFAFSGSFSGAFRDVPLRAGESMTDILVLEEGVPYEPGASTALGSSDVPGRYGVEVLGNVARIVWHYSAVDEVRTFTITYRFVNVAVVYDDVVDVNLKVWGDEWKEGVGRLEAEVLLPGAAAPGDVLVFGHPASVDGSTSLGADGVSPRLEARDIPSRQFVELRTVFPTAMLESTTGALVQPGPGLGQIIAEEEAEVVRAVRQRNATRNSLLTVAMFGLVLCFNVFADALQDALDPKSA